MAVAKYELATPVRGRRPQSRPGLLPVAIQNARRFTWTAVQGIRIATATATDSAAPGRPPRPSRRPSSAD